MTDYSGWMTEPRREPSLERQLWLGSVPHPWTYEDVRDRFRDLGLCRPAHIQLGKGRELAQYAIVTFKTAADADGVYHWAHKARSTFTWHRGRHAVVRRSKGNVEWAPMLIMLADSPFCLASLPAAAALHLGRCYGKMV